MTLAETASAVKNERMKKIVVLTGAGISAESGLSTFRDAGGLWDNYPVEQVATPEGWARDPPSSPGSTTTCAGSSSPYGRAAPTSFWLAWNNTTPSRW